ncbi:conserved hypothetical protein [Psychromonas ingrahamii 37]|uniref:Uncharacterized protein n=1 Tax=Psychromonas ingrahamii (strain DSM 17664 / CCUG 51855 / 37) TaxID=357804 RepID=A1SZN3_PSYIN|nr:hypothetical protein [Psychromonas ingrahamii]ABM04948.1 conserved hypothetical protein [Psychromonas ingrahamii 37]
MLDAICNYDPDNPKTYSIFEFKILAASELDKLRHFLICPVCQQKAYFRKASIDGRQACFGSRYHKIDCAEFNPSVRKKEEEKQLLEVEKVLLESDSLVIDFSAPLVKAKNIPEKASKSVKKIPNKVLNTQPAEVQEAAKSESKVSKQGLKKLLMSLLRGSSLADSDLWIYTSEKHKWRAKNLFVNIRDAQPMENNAPRIYWGTISNADKTLNWLNPVENSSAALPISKYRDELLSHFDIKEAVDLESAGFILFGKCVLSKDKKRRFIHLWGNDLQYLYLLKK